MDNPCPHKCNGGFRKRKLKFEEMEKRNCNNFQIEKACKWLIANARNLDYVNMDGDLYDMQFVDDFRKYMEQGNEQANTHTSI